MVRSAQGPGDTSGYDRSFIREWQANPPKGYPTLSKANLVPTKAAVTRYEEIVKSGGFVAVPEVEMENGLTHAAVGTAAPAAHGIGRAQRRPRATPTISAAISRRR